MSAMRAQQLIETLQLQPHPEGGWFREVFRSAAQVAPADGRPARQALTTIYFMLQAHQHSRWHRVASDEVWIHLEGVPLALWISDAALRTAPAHVRLGPVDVRGTRPAAHRAGRPLAGGAADQCAGRRLHARQLHGGAGFRLRRLLVHAVPTATRPRCCATIGRSSRR